MGNIIEKIFAMNDSGVKSGKIAKELNIPVHIVVSMLKANKSDIINAVSEVVDNKKPIHETAKKFKLRATKLRLACSLFLPGIITKLDQDSEQIIIQHMKAGLSVDDVNGLTGVPKYRINKIYKPFKKDKISAEKVIKKLIAGEMVSKIASKYGYTISKILRIARSIEPSLNKTPDINVFRANYAKKQVESGVSIIDVSTEMNEPFLKIAGWISKGPETLIHVENLDEERTTELIKRIKEGHSVRNIGIEFGLIQSSIKSFAAKIRGPNARRLGNKRRVNAHLVDDLSKSELIRSEVSRLAKDKSIKEISTELSISINDVLKVMVPEDQTYLDIEKGSICKDANFPDGSYMDYILLKMIKNQKVENLVNMGIGDQVLNKFIKTRFNGMRLWTLRDQYSYHGKITIPKVLLKKKSK